MKVNRERVVDPLGASLVVTWFCIEWKPMIPQDLLDILVCPACKQPILRNGDESLKCSACRRVYPIRDNIPILLIDEAVIDPS
ncbi:MAG TPA: Trm112 family protein [Terriglobales bacterium]|nr:Trm112 family protein [Terriglobales bacterium]